MLKCSTCKGTSNLSPWNITTSGRQLYRCRDCYSIYMRKYSKTKKGKEAINEASKRAYIKHKVKWIARAKARYAVKKGILIKSKWCEMCNLVKPLQGHHEDYTKPLEVIWLCTNCHADADKILEASPQQRVRVLSL